MPTVQWEWKFGPASILGTAQLFVLIIGVGMWYGRQQTEQDNSVKTIARLEAIVDRVTASQMASMERVTKVETKVDLMIPALHRIEARQISPGYPSGGGP